MAKPNCYECKFRRNIPGDAHSMCSHEKGCGTETNPFTAMFDGKSDPKGLGIVGDEHGIRCGWFYWPFNFDPAWLKECGGFEKRD